MRKRSPEVEALMRRRAAWAAALLRESAALSGRDEAEARVRALLPYLRALFVQEDALRLCEVERDDLVALVVTDFRGHHLLRDVLPFGALGPKGYAVLIMLVEAANAYAGDLRITPIPQGGGFGVLWIVDGHAGALRTEEEP